VDRPTLVLPSEESIYGRRAPLAVPLWVCGSLEGLSAPAVALVGSRAPSGGGRRLAFEVARELACCGVCVISGLALGIDGAAHEGALAGGGPTIGVLGGGHEHFFPRRHRALADAIVAGGGAVVSPFPPAHEVFPHQFLARNRIVAALADGVVVVEAAARSGALNTASHGADLGLPVMAFPGDVDRAKVAGCLALLRDGATLVRDARDILEAIGVAHRAPPACGGPPLGEGERRIVGALRQGETAFDALLARLGLQAAELAAHLVDLELRGVVESRSGARYALR